MMKKLFLKSAKNEFDIVIGSVEFRKIGYFQKLSLWTLAFVRTQACFEKITCFLICLILHSSGSQWPWNIKMDRKMNQVGSITSKENVILCLKLFSIFGTLLSSTSQRPWIIKMTLKMSSLGSISPSKNVNSDYFWTF